MIAPKHKNFKFPNEMNVRSKLAGISIKFGHMGKQLAWLYLSKKKNTC